MGSFAKHHAGRFKINGFGRALQCGRKVNGTGQITLLDVIA
jgi:hypothetical protein